MWNVSLLRVDCFGNSQARRLDSWLVDGATELVSYNGVAVVHGVRVWVSKGQIRKCTHTAKAQKGPLCGWTCFGDSLAERESLKD
jgi:hypothetical protein